MPTRRTREPFRCRGPRRAKAPKTPESSAPRPYMGYVSSQWHTRQPQAPGQLAAISWCQSHAYPATERAAAPRTRARRTAHEASQSLRRRSGQMVKAQGRCASPDGDYCTTKTRHACKDPSPWQERILLQGLVPPKEQWHGNRTAVAIKASSKSSSPLSSWPCFHHFVALAAHLAAHSLPTSYLAECQKSAPGSHKPSSGLVVIERARASPPSPLGAAPMAALPRLKPSTAGAPSPAKQGGYNAQTMHPIGPQQTKNGRAPVRRTDGRFQITRRAPNPMRAASPPSSDPPKDALGNPYALAPKN